MASKNWTVKEEENISRIANSVIMKMFKHFQKEFENMLEEYPEISGTGMFFTICDIVNRTICCHNIVSFSDETNLTEIQFLAKQLSKIEQMALCMFEYKKNEKNT